jgi:hypothetical protein
LDRRARRRPRPIDDRRASVAGDAPKHRSSDRCARSQRRTEPFALASAAGAAPARRSSRQPHPRPPKLELMIGGRDDERASERLRWRPSGDEWSAGYRITRARVLFASRRRSHHSTHYHYLARSLFGPTDRRIHQPTNTLMMRIQAKILLRFGNNRRRTSNHVIQTCFLQGQHILACVLRTVRSMNELIQFRFQLHSPLTLTIIIIFTPLHA